MIIVNTDNIKYKNVQLLVNSDGIKWFPVLNKVVLTFGRHYLSARHMREFPEKLLKVKIVESTYKVS